MSDPITIGAGLGAGLAVLRGGDFKDTLKGATLGGLGGSGYGALTGKGMAGNLLSQGGLINSIPAGFTGATGEIGSNAMLGTGSIPPNLLDKIGSGISSIGTYAKENPLVAMTGLSAAQNLMQKPTAQLPQNQQSIASQSQFDQNAYIPKSLQSQSQFVDVNAPQLGATQPYRTFGFGGANMFRDPKEAYMMNLNYPQY